ncbi:tRNA dihydrouridine(20/20a) synthase DusA [soil metagenome]
MVISIAPMMDYTDRHYRMFMRFITRGTLLYTEMVPTQMLIRGNRWDVLDFSAEERPLALQLGGANPTDLALCAARAEALGYDEVNLNVGCPSDRVQAGRFGACLMKEPEVVAACVAAMSAAVRIPITVKTRLGVDDLDSYEALHHFITLVAAAGCKTFIIHARKAWLQGLSPKENRDIPPLCYERVYQLKQDFPQLKIIINGGIKTVEEVETHLQYVDGAMLGREACKNPYLFASLEQRFFNSDVSSSSLPTRQEVLTQYVAYISKQLQQNVSMRLLIRPLLGLFHGQPYSREWRGKLSSLDMNRFNQLHKNQKLIHDLVYNVQTKSIKQEAYNQN